MPASDGQTAGPASEEAASPQLPVRRAPFVSLGSKLTIAISLLLALGSAAVYAMLSQFGWEMMLAGKEHAARMAGELFLRSASTPVIFDDPTGIHETLALLNQDPDVLGVELWRVTAARGLGKPLASARKARTSLGAPQAPARWVDAVALERRPDRIVFRGPVRDRDGQVIAVAVADYSLARENAGFAQLRRRLLLAAALGALLTGLSLAAITRRTITGPLTQLLGAVKQVEGGQRADMGAALAHDEVGRLADAFGRMAEVVQRREQDVARRNQDMKRVLDNVGQGFLVLDPEGRMAAERSSIFDRWFGEARPGQLLADYLRPADPEAAEMLELGLSTIRAGVMPLEVCVGQLPDRIRRGERYYACQYHPVASGETLHQLVLVISDITSDLERERSEREQRDVLAAVSRLMSDKAGFLEFLRETSELVGRIVHAGPEPRVVAQVMRDVHTLKGTCAVFGLAGIASHCHHLEEHILAGGSLPSDEDRMTLRRLWGALTDKLGPFMGGGRRTVELGLDEYRRFAAAVQGQTAHDQLLEILQNWTDDPVLPRLHRLGEYAEILAGRLGKCRVEVEVADTRRRLPSEPWSQLWPGLSHLVRNAVDHGFETEGERLRAGKPAAGRLRLEVADTQEGLDFVIADDGRGIDWEAVRRRAARMGLPSSTQQDLVAALFVDGVSTVESPGETSGRGVGLAAVRQAVQTLGGRVIVESRAGLGSRFVLHVPRPTPGRSKQLGDAPGLTLGAGSADVSGA
jgi:two-component system chemotaxis sensor kinase CheA